eukprot:COSAG01_NODE_25465_length_743_cov_1.249612_1_plen_108_part_10
MEIDEFWKRQGRLRRTQLVDGLLPRCPHCNRWDFPSLEARNTHRDEKCRYRPRERSRRSNAMKLAERAKRRTIIAGLRKLKLSDVEIANVLEFKYLGQWITADGDELF